MARTGWGWWINAVSALRLALFFLALGVEFAGIYLTWRALGPRPTRMIRGGRTYQKPPGEVVDEIEAHRTKRYGIYSLAGGVAVLVLHAVLGFWIATPALSTMNIWVLALAGGSGIILGAAVPVALHSVRWETELKDDIFERACSDAELGRSERPYRNHLISLGNERWPKREDESPEQYAERVFGWTGGLAERF